MATVPIQQAIEEEERTGIICATMFYPSDGTDSWPTACEYKIWIEIIMSINLALCSNVNNFFFTSASIFRLTCRYLSHFEFTRANITCESKQNFRRFSNFSAHLHKKPCLLVALTVFITKRAKSV